MNELVPHNDKLEKARRAALSDFKPEETFEVTSVLKSAAEHAARMRDWEACWTAVDWLVQRIAKHVAWWNANVSVRHASGTKKIAGLRSSLTAEKAAAETGISPQTISRWKVGTARPDFRERIFNRCHRQAFSDTEKRADKQTGEMEWYTPDIYISMRRVRFLATLILTRRAANERNSPFALASISTPDKTALSKNGLVVFGSIRLTRAGWWRRSQTK